MPGPDSDVSDRESAAARLLSRLCLVVASFRNDPSVLATVAHAFGGR
jgi:hypothetical protein